MNFIRTMRGLACGFGFIVAVVGVGVFDHTAQAGQGETPEEKETNLKKQAMGGLFQKWTFDKDQPNGTPAGFVGLASGHARAAGWMVQRNATAPSPPNVVGVSSGCPSGPCYQLLLAEGFKYEYPDLAVRFRASEETSGVGGLVFGAKDAANFYGAVVDLTELTIQIVRMVAEEETVLAQTPVSLKAVTWHSLRVQRNTIISKDFIETYVDGTLVLSVQDQTLGLGQVGLLASGESSLLFDTFHAIPLFSNRPLSLPPAY